MMLDPLFPDDQDIPIFSFEETFFPLLLVFSSPLSFLSTSH